jgi:hypothetical protein
MRILIALALLVSAAIAPLHAEEQAPDPVKKAKALALIADAKVDGVWRTDEAGEITHIRSGLRCAVSDADDPTQLTDLTVFPNNDKGSDVSCGFSSKGKAGQTTLTLYVYLANGRTAEQLLEEAVSAIRQAHADWKSIPAPEIGISITDQKGRRIVPLSARFEQSGSPAQYSSVWVGVAGLWAIKVRATYPQADAQTAELRSVIKWTRTHLQVEPGPAAK